MLLRVRTIVGLMLFSSLIIGCGKDLTTIDLSQIEMYIPREDGKQILSTDKPVYVKYPLEDRYLDLCLNLSRTEQLNLITAIRENKLKGEIVVKQADGTELARKEIRYFWLRKKSSTCIVVTFDQIKGRWVADTTFTHIPDTLMTMFYGDKEERIPQEIYLSKPEDFDIYKNNPVMVYIVLSYMDVKENKVMHFSTEPKLLVFEAHKIPSPPPPSADPVHTRIEEQLKRMGWSGLETQKVIAICDTLRRDMNIDILSHRLNQGDSLHFSLSDLVQFIPESLAKKQLSDSLQGYKMREEFEPGEYDVAYYPFLKEAAVAVCCFVNYVVVPHLDHACEYELRIVGFADKRRVRVANEFAQPVYYYTYEDFKNYLDRRIYYKKIRERNVLVDANEKLKRLDSKIIDNFQLSHARAFSVFNLMSDYLDAKNIDLKYSIVGYGVEPEVEKIKYRRRVDIVFKKYESGYAP